MTATEQEVARDYAKYILMHRPGNRQGVAISRYLLQALDELARTKDRLHDANAKVRRLQQERQEAGE